MSARRILALAAWLGATLTGSTSAQSLASRVAQVKDGTVQFAFASRPDACSGPDGTFSGNIQIQCRAGKEWVCEYGPALVALTFHGGDLVAVRSTIARWWRRNPPADTKDLGQVPVREATDVLLHLAATSRGVGSHLIAAAMFADPDSVTLWPDLIRIARRTDVPRKTRQAAVFWVGQAASNKATEGLADLLDDEDQDRGVREQAVFALSQRPNGKGVPALLKAARTHRDPAIRRKALFWLGQSDDPRALALLEELLAKP
ncbi:MAG: HEAT repeat domain-containing protein [Gemmatimonadota bacterium]